MKKIIRKRALAFCAAVILLTSGCGRESGTTTVPDESTAEAIEKIQIEIEYDGDEVLGEAIRKVAEGFNSSQDIYMASVGSAGINLQDFAGRESTEDQQDEASGAASTESLTDEASGAESLADDGAQTTGTITASVVFTDDNMAAAFASDGRRLDLRTCPSGESGKNSLYTVIDSLPEHMYKTVCDEEQGIFYLPVSVIAPVLYYNKTVYDGLGLSLPQSFSQLRDNSLNIYAKYRTPGYLPYDLEGDVIAMMREQAALASQSESGSESDVEVGAAGAQSSDAGAQAGDENAGADNAGAQAGDASTQTGNAGTQSVSGSTDKSELQPALTDAEVLQFFAGNCEAGYFRMIQHEAYPALDFATGAVAAFAGTPDDYEMATAGVTFDVGTIPWIMDHEDAVYWVDTSGMLFFEQGNERNAGAAAFAEYMLSGDVCSEFLESVGGLSPYRTVYESQAYRKNRRGFNEIMMAASEEIPRADFVLMSDAKRRELDELLLYIIDKRVTAEDAEIIFSGS